MAAELVVRASVWVALTCYPAGPLGAWLRRGDERWQRRARWIWTLGAAAFAVHAVSAFHVFYEWSHAAGLRETARQVTEVTGRPASGSGLWLNYLFTLLWAGDAGWWWRAPESYRRRRPAIGLTLHAFFLFMIWTATVIFEEGWVRLLGWTVTLTTLAALAAGRPWRRAAA